MKRSSPASFPCRQLGLLALTTILFAASSFAQTPFAEDDPQVPAPKASAAERCREVPEDAFGQCVVSVVLAEERHRAFLNDAATYEARQEDQARVERVQELERARIRERVLFQTVQRCQKAGYLGSPKIGMPFLSVVECSWGWPISRRRYKTAAGTTEFLSYDSGRMLTMVNGKVTAIAD